MEGPFLHRRGGLHRGLILGGTAGLGTIWWLLVIGPTVQVTMGLFDHSRLDSVWSDLTRRELPWG